MIERWSRDQVLALAPDTSSRKAAQGVATPAKWPVRGHTGMVVYGECKGSGSTPYLACVDLSEPAYRCSCPSRKFPCKHALGLLLLWSDEAVPAEAGAPQWVTEWLDSRAARAAKSAARAATPADTTATEQTSAEQTAAGKTAAGEQAAGEQVVAEQAAAGATLAGPDGGGSVGGDEASGDAGGVGNGAQRVSAGGRGGSRAAGAESVRHGRVAAGLAELERWLADQVRQGLAVAAEHDWEGLAKRLIDAQAPGVAGMVSRLSRVRAEEGWPGRLLEEYALLNLLAVAYRRRAELPPDLARTVLIRVGFPVTKEEVLTGPVVRDVWHVLGRRDETQDRLTARRVWLRGRRTRRAALILSFAPQGQPLDASLVTGTAIDADLAYYPGAAPLRALVATRHTPAMSTEEPEPVPPGMTPAEALDEVARALAEDPWTESWPLVLTGVVPDRRTIGGLPLHPRSHDPWRLIAVSGGHPLTVAAEWTPAGLRPLTTWDDEGTTVIL
ncbi:SWIM zinc finger family protein [Nonomuraea sp. NPDC049421]|uniref:SWIM zinc finger family protein n=1 Tax=Nonomuraea sp. NPDC049421 TaxID=3155275 RepID=UPI003425AD23